MEFKHRDPEAVSTMADILDLYRSRTAGEFRCLDVSCTNIEDGNLRMALSNRTFNKGLMALAVHSCWGLLSGVTFAKSLRSCGNLRILDVSDMQGAYPEVAKICCTAVKHCRKLLVLNMSENDVVFEHMLTLFCRIAKYGCHLQQLQLRKVVVVDVPTTFTFVGGMLGPCALLMYKLMRTCLNRLDLTGLKVSGDQLKTGVFFELIRRNCCLVELRKDDLFTALPGIPTVLDCRRLRHHDCVASSPHLPDRNWPARFNEEPAAEGQELPAFRRETEDAARSCIKETSDTWVETSCRE